MVDDSNVSYFGMRVWNYYDSFVSNNSIYIELFNTFSNDNMSAQKIKIGVGKNSVFLDISAVYRLIRMIKSIIIGRLNDHKTKVTQDQSYTDGFSLEAKKNIYITYMWCPSTNSPCIRVIVGEKIQTVLESDKGYIPIVEFLSFYEILNQIFNNHVSSSFNNYIWYQLKFLNDEYKKNREDLKKRSEDIVKVIDTMTETKKIKEPEKEEIINIDKDKEIKKNQNEFDSFLKDNRDSFDLDLGDFSLKEEVQKKTEKSIVYESKFLKSTLKNDFENLEIVITNCVNSNLPFDSFVQSVKLNSNIDLYDGFSKCDINSLNYIINRSIKTNINLYIQKKIKLPSATIPIIVDNNRCDEDTTDMMYQLFLSYVYIGKIRTLLKEKFDDTHDNKDLFAYALKTITSPIVFSFLLKVDREVFKNSIIRLYRNNLDNGFYKNYEDKLKKFGITSFILSDDYLKDQALRIYDTATKVRDKLQIKNFFNNKILVLKYDDFVGNDIDLNSVYKLCELDWNYLNNGGAIDNSKLAINSYDDIPLSILNKYGINNQKYDNSILIKYFDLNLPKFFDLEQIKRINNSVYDILDNIDITNYPEKALKAIYFWDMKKLPKGLTYNQFCNMIDKSSLTSNMLISMILENKNNDYDQTFLNSYIVANVRI